MIGTRWESTKGGWFEVVEEDSKGIFTIAFDNTGNLQKGVIKSNILKVNVTGKSMVADKVLRKQRKQIKILDNKDKIERNKINRLSLPFVQRSLVCGVGIIDVPMTRQEAAKCKILRKWRAMLRRCSNSYWRKNPAYIGVKCDPVWYLFSNFKSWTELQN